MKKKKSLIKKRFLKSDKHRKSQIYGKDLLCKPSTVLAGDCIIVFLWLYKSATRYRRLAKKDLVYHGRVGRMIKCRFCNVFYGRCIKINKRAKKVELRSYCGDVGIKLSFFVGSPNFINFYVLNYHRRFKYKNENTRAKLYRFVDDYISKMKRLKNY